MSDVLFQADMEKMESLRSEIATLKNQKRLLNDEIRSLKGEITSLKDGIRSLKDDRKFEEMVYNKLDKRYDVLMEKFEWAKRALLDLNVSNFRLY